MKKIYKSNSISKYPSGNRSNMYIVFSMVLLSIIFGISINFDDTEEYPSLNNNMQYEVILTCELMGERRIALVSCLPSSSIEVRSGNFSKIYQQSQLLVSELTLDLTEPFEVSALNTSTSQGPLLRLKITDKSSGTLVYDRFVGQYDGIMAADWMFY